MRVALLLSALASVQAGSFSSTRIVEGYEPDHLTYEAELVDDVDHSLAEHRFAALHETANGLLSHYHNVETYLEAEMVDDLASHRLGEDERFLQTRMTTGATSTLPLDLGLNAYSNGGTPSGYAISGNEFDNPLTSTDLIPILPNAPDCTVRGNTVLEVKKIRKSALGLNQAVAAELDAMHKRKAYVEQMTTYLNDRIRELNKVKLELGSEIRWVFASEQKISQLSNVEKLIKMQDILSCLNTNTKITTQETTDKTTLMTAMQAKATALQADIAAASTKIADLQAAATVAPA